VLGVCGRQGYVAQSAAARVMEFRFQFRFLGQLAQSIHCSSWCSKLAGTLLLSVLFVSAPSFCADPPRPAKILVLWFGDKDSPALTKLDNGLRTTMERELDAPLWIYDESFDESWLGEGSPYAQRMERFLNDKYANRGIDIVVAVGNYPLQYMQQRRKTLLPNAKLMYLSWQSPQPPVPDATGMVWSSDLAPTLEVALTQNPGTHHVLLVTGATVPDRALGQLFLSTGLKYLQKKHPDVDIQILSPGTLDKTLSTLAALPKDTITVFTTYYGDSAGQGFVPARILSVFAATTNRPMYGWVDTFLGRGIVGGSLINIEAMGAAFGDLALRVAHGEKPGTIPEVRGDFRQNEFDWKQLRRWGIGMDKVPADSIVINREHTLWERYQWQIAGLVGLGVIGVVLIVNLTRLTIAQRQHLKQLAYQRELETLVAQFAAGLINRPAEFVDAEIDQSFQRLLEFFELDRISVFHVSAEAEQLRLLHTRTTAGITPPPPVIDLNKLPRTATQIREGKTIVISSLGQPTEEAIELSEFLRARGILSLVAFPLQREQKTFALMAFSAMRKEREWKPDLLQSLRTVADIFGSALERKHAEEVMSGNRNQLTSIVESAMDAIIAVDDQERILVFNATAEKIFGCPMKEALGQSLERFLPNRFRGEHYKHIARFAKTGVTNRSMGTLGALWALRANGEEFPIEASISQADVDGRKLFTVILRDVTERERAGQALRESEARFRLVANAAPVLIWMSGTDKLCTYFNQPWLDFTGRRLEDELGNGWATGVHPDDLKNCLETYNQAFDRRQAFKMEYRLRGHDGKFRWMLDTGVPRIGADGSFAGYIGSCVDVNERIVAEQQLSKIHELNVSILDSLRNHLAVLDSRGTIVAATNRGPEFLAVSGINLLDLQVGANYFEICRAAVEAGDGDVAAALAGVQAVYERKQNYFELEFDYESGINQRWFLMSVTPLKTQDGGVVISHQDITERKRHEQAIHDLSGSLINAQEQERSRIARELHDDINQQVAMLAIEIQQLENTFPEDSLEARQKIRALWSKTHALSTDIQHLSHQLHSSKLEHLGIIAALRGLCDEFSQQHKIKAEFQFRQVSQGIDSNITLSLFRVAQESLRNVAKHSRAQKVRLELFETGGRIVLRVSDDGVGFDPESPENQTGLGMISMTERIRLVGGSLSVTSRPSLGTQVEAAVPLLHRDRTSQSLYAERKTG
jgi:PAS domain S-box-containing protein